MLSGLVKNHQARQNELKEENERLRKAAVSSVGAVTNAMVNSLNNGVSQVFNNQRLLENESKQLQALSMKYSKQASQWLSVVEGFNQALKEIGDVETWSKSIEADMRSIAYALEFAATGKESDRAFSVSPYVSSKSPSNESTTAASPTTDAPTSAPTPAPAPASAPDTPAPEPANA